MKKRHEAEEIIRILRDVEAAPSVAEGIRRNNISDQAVSLVLYPSYPSSRPPLHPCPIFTFPIGGTCKLETVNGKASLTILRH